jgi:hypothetical protein
MASSIATVVAAVEARGAASAVPRFSMCAAVVALSGDFGGRSEEQAAMQDAVVSHKEMERAFKRIIFYSFQPLLRAGMRSDAG